MATWVIGDVHGCADELARLLERLALGAEDRVLLLGDLFHRGPGPLAVARLATRVGAAFLLGNHEHALLARLGLAPEAPESWPSALAPGADLRGDFGRPLCAEAGDGGELVDFLRGHSGTLVESTSFVGAGATSDGRAWCAVHAGLTPGLPARASRVADRLSPARVDGPRSPFWFHAHPGPELVLFGHLVQPGEPLVIERAGRKLAIGLDTGALYGGSLTAYCPERDEFRSVRAARAYVRR